MSNRMNMSSKPIYENADFIRFARRHAYAIREGFFDGVERDRSRRASEMDFADRFGHAAVEMLRTIRETTVQLISHFAGITEAEATDALDEWNQQLEVTN